MIVGALTGATLAVSFITQWYLVTRLGAGAETDALFAALAVPQFVIAVAANPLLHVLVPLLSVESEERFGIAVWTIFPTVLLVFMGVGLVLFVSASIWAPLLVPGFSPSGRALMVSLARVHLLGMVLMGATTMLRSVHNARHAFVRAAVSSTLGSIAGLAFLVFALPTMGVLAAAWGFALRSAVEFGLLTPVLGRFTTPAWGTILPEFWRRIRPLVLGASYERTEIVLDRVLSSLAPTGGLTLLYLGQQIYGAVGQVLNRGIVDPVVPRLARAAEGGEWKEFRALVRHRLWWIAMVTATGFAALAVAGRPGLQAVFGVGNLQPADVLLLWSILIVLAGVLVGDPIGNLLSSSFYAKADTLTPTRIGVAAYTVGVALKTAGYFLGGVIGIGTGTSAYYVVRAAALHFALFRGIRGAIVKSMWHN